MSSEFLLQNRRLTFTLMANQTSGGGLNILQNAWEAGSL